jgi:hypothetical protein
MRTLPFLLAALLLSFARAAEPVVLLANAFDAVPEKPWLMPHGLWKADGSGLRGTEDPAEHHGASVKGFASFVDATFEYEVRFDGGRVHTLGINQPRAHLFHIDFKPDRLLIVKNDLDKDGPEKPEVIAQAALKLAPGTWYPVRVTIRGNTVEASIAEVSLKAVHTYVGREKGSFNLYVNGDSVCFRKFRLLAPHP